MYVYIDIHIHIYVDTICVYVACLNIHKDIYEYM